jgi:hypothetical protein
VTSKAGTKQIALRIPPELAPRLKDVVGDGSVTRFIVNALEFAVRVAKQEKRLEDEIVEIELKTSATRHKIAKLHGERGYSVSVEKIIEQEQRYARAERHKPKTGDLQKEVAKLSALERKLPRCEGELSAIRHNLRRVLFACEAKVSAGGEFWGDDHRMQDLDFSFVPDEEAHYSFEHDDLGQAIENWDEARDNFGEGPSFDPSDDSWFNE